MAVQTITAKSLADLAAKIGFHEPHVVVCRKDLWDKLLNGSVVTTPIHHFNGLPVYLEATDEDCTARSIVLQGEGKRVHRIIDQEEAHAQH